MSEERVICATYSEWAPVKSRNALKLIFEVPLEQQQEVLNILGAPLPGRELWCAIALLNETTKKREDRTVQRCVMLCKDRSFQNWVTNSIYEIEPKESWDDEEWAKQCVYAHCGIKTRADLAYDKEARALWEEMLGAFIQDTKQP